MASLEKIHESPLPLAWRELIQEIRAVAAEIYYLPGGYGEKSRLAQELDRRKIRPVTKPAPGQPNRWYIKGRASKQRTLRLSNFINSYIPQLTYHGYRRLADEKPQCLCAGCHSIKTPNCPLTRLDTPVRNPQLDKPKVRQIANREPSAAIGNWTVRQDKHGYFRAYKKINGKLKSVYIGKTLDGGEEKLRAAYEKWT